MYNEGTTKALWALVAAILLAVGLAFKTQTLFLLRFVFDLIRMNSTEWWLQLKAFLLHYWPF